VLVDVVEGVRRGGSGRKLQALAGRAETRVKISEMRRCCTAVSLWECQMGSVKRGFGGEFTSWV